MYSLRFKTFSAAPHRVMMFGGSVQLLATLLYWGTELTGRYTALWSPLPTVIPTTYGHAFLMLYTLFPFFIFGFLLTTYPRWMNGTEVPERRYVGAFGWLASGTVTFYLGLLIGRPLLLAAAAMVLIGYLLTLSALWQVYRHAAAADKFYESWLNLALICGAGGIIAYIGWLYTFQALLLQIAIKAGLWFFLLPIAVSVCHRMIPYFSSCVLPGYRAYQPPTTLIALYLLLLCHGFAELFGALRWLWMVDIPLLALALWHSWRWSLRRAMTVHLLAVLHIAFFWFAIALALYVAQDLAIAFFDTVVLGRAPLHAMAIGFLLSLTLAMATRVTLGHSGRPLQADTTTWVLFWGIGIAALLRIVAETPHYAGFNLAAVAAWLIVTAIWTAKYAPIYLRKRVDGKPG